MVPVLIALESYQCNKFNSFFDYLLTRFAVLDANWQIIDLIPYSDVDGLYDKIGKNTKYIIHPEEILADNFVLLLNNQLSVSSPEILEAMINVFKNNK